jgi:probable addiction module antidote protein
MAKRIKVADLLDFDAAPYLDSEEAVAAYLTDILEANDPALLAAALGDIARARGMSEIAKASGLTREALYKALRAGAQPRFDTISRVCAALGVRLVAQPVHTRSKRIACGQPRKYRGRPLEYRFFILKTPTFPPGLFSGLCAPIDSRSVGIYSFF